MVLNDYSGCSQRIDWRGVGWEVRLTGREYQRPGERWGGVNSGGDSGHSERRETGGVYAANSHSIPHIGAPHFK